MNSTGSQSNTTLWQDLRALPPRYWILFSGTLINRFGHFVIPFLAVYLRKQGYEGWVTGSALAAFGAGALVAGGLGGYLADRLGRKPTLLISCAGAALSMLVLSQVTGVVPLIGAVFANGLLSALYFPAASAMLAELVPVPLRVRAFSCQRLAANLGFALGMATAGFVAQHSFLLLFVADAGTTFILGLAILFGLRGARAPASERAGWIFAIRHLRGNPAFLKAVAASFLIALVFWQMSSTYGLQVIEGAGLGENVYGLLLAVNGLMIVCFELPLTSFTRRFAPTRVMAAGYALVGLGMGFNIFGAGLWILAGSMVLFTIGEMVALPIAQSYMANLAPDEMRGRYMGVLSLAWSSATMIGPAAGVALFHFNPPLLWVAVCLLAFLAGAVVLSTGKAEETVGVPDAKPAVEG